jgi:hypothetical protein
MGDAGQRTHTFCFVPMHYWAVVLIALAALPFVLRRWAILDVGAAASAVLFDVEHLVDAASLLLASLGRAT